MQSLYASADLVDGARCVMFLGYPSIYMCVHICIHARVEAFSDQLAVNFWLVVM